MSKRKPFALRINESILKGMQRWADDELRSLNAQIEYVLRQSLWDAGRLRRGDHTDDDTQSSKPDPKDNDR